MTGTEKRKNLRVSFKTTICLRPIKQGAMEIHSDQTRDISLKGIYCYSDTQFPIGTPCEVKLRLTDSNSTLVIYIEARVIRSDKSGMGIKFEKMDIDSFLHLKNILYYNTGDPERIEQELIGED